MGLLYGVYQYAKLLGVVFTLHGDIIPDEPYEGSLLVSGKGNLARFDFCSIRLNFCEPWDNWVAFGERWTA